ncbi:PepSY-associated TM helix domain-containing protein [Verrucomicrobium sp. BvORR106]|uniref:PepSY-associated TM helix domain-containing protein n=1 Tax=Verrucomicrobium sp. BvORR106 TaxID=1403819 RepID=UPI00056F5A4E|nr:PepSY-associated TM helix domain-containing protein [Verrucomicrobium sp. BvORR106]
MKKTFRQSMAWLHTWTGLLLGWVLFAIMVTGTATYFRHEITRWMQPEMPTHAPDRATVNAGLTRLQEIASKAGRWGVELPDARSGAASIWWQEGLGRQGFKREVLPALDQAGPTPQVRDTRGGEFFYRFHFQLQLPHPWGRYLAGAAAMFMFMALISGIVTHRQFFKDFFAFRPGKNNPRTALDLHNVTAVLALPFYLLISYSALVIFMHMYLPWAEKVLPEEKEAGSRPKAAQMAGDKASSEQSASGVPDLAMILRLYDKAQSQWTTGAGPGVRRLEISSRNSPEATVAFSRFDEGGVGMQRAAKLEFNGITGEAVEQKAERKGIVTAIHSVIYGLHLARFAGTGLRWGFFFMGMMGSVLVATGLVLWTLKRRNRHLSAGRVPFGHWLVERLNIATITGLFIAIGTLFWANRLLPLSLAGRGDWEVDCFLYAWGFALLHACVRPVGKAWREQLILVAFLFSGLPLLDAFTVGTYLRSSVRAGQWAHEAFDVAVLVLGLVAWTAAVRLAGRKVKQSGKSPTRPTASQAQDEPASEVA